MIKLKSLLMIKVSIPPHHTSPLLKMKDSLEMLQRIKLLEILLILFLMQKDLSEESSKMPLFKLILNSGHLKLNLVQMTNHSSLFNTKEKPKNSKLNKSHQWFLQR